MKEIHIGFAVYPGFTQLDATGPAQVLSLVPGAIIHMVASDLKPVQTDAGFSIVPTDTFDDCPQLQVLCVPGGYGQAKTMRDPVYLKFLKDQGQTADYVTSVCSGSLLLGSAGLLNGFQATSHWTVIDLLPNFGAIPVSDRVARDRNRITGGGVTAGIDFGLTLAAELAGEEVAREIQLTLEYNPAPPFNSGSPDTADPKLVKSVRQKTFKR